MLAELTPDSKFLSAEIAPLLCVRPVIGGRGVCEKKQASQDLPVRLARFREFLLKAIKAL